MSFKENMYNLPSGLVKDGYRMVRHNKELHAWGKLLFKEATALTKTTIKEAARTTNRLLK